MSTFTRTLITAAIVSFTIGVIWSRPSERSIAEYPSNTLPPSIYQMSKPLTYSPTVNMDDPNLVMPVQSRKEPDTNLKPCSETTTMPCEVSPHSPLKEELDAKDSGPGLFKRGEMVTCIYQGIFWWDNRDEFVKTVPMVCKVLQASEAWDDIEPNYQHIQIDCSKDLTTKWSDQPGAGMVKNHKLNFKVRWYNSNNCYHFVQK